MRKNTVPPFIGASCFMKDDLLYHFNPMVIKRGEVNSCMEIQKTFIEKEHAKLRDTFLDDDVILVRISKVFDSPLIPGVKGETEVETALLNDFLTNINSIEFHQQYFDFLVRKQQELLLEYVADQMKCKASDFSLSDYLYICILDYFAGYTIGKKLSIVFDVKRVQFIKDCFDELNAGAYIITSETSPDKEGDVEYLLLWQQRRT